MNCALQCYVPFDATKMQLLMQENFTVHMSLSSFILFCILMPLFFLQNYRLATSYHSFFLLAIYHPLVVLNVIWTLTDQKESTNLCKVGGNIPSRSFFFKLEVACFLFYCSLYILFLNAYKLTRCHSL